MLGAPSTFSNAIKRSVSNVSKVSGVSKRSGQESGKGSKHNSSVNLGKDKTKNKEFMIQEDIKRLKIEYADVIGKQEDFAGMYKT